MIAVIIIVIVLLVIAAALYATVLSPGARQRRRLQTERSEAADHHREVASQRDTEADAAEREAIEARQRAERAEERAEKRRTSAEDHAERADLHDEGRADEELPSGPDASRESETGPSHTMGNHHRGDDRADLPPSSSQPTGAERITDDRGPGAHDARTDPSAPARERPAGEDRI